MSHGHESWIERRIREATERGEFADLPGAGRPLDLGDPDDPDWWVRRKLAREGLDMSAVVPAVIALRREAASYPESLLDVVSADRVREILRDYNMRMIADRRRPVTGQAMPAVAPRIDVEDMVARWEVLRAERAAAAGTAGKDAADDADGPASQARATPDRSPRRPRLWLRLLLRRDRRRRAGRGADSG